MTAQEIAMFAKRGYSIVVARCSRRATVGTTTSRWQKASSLIYNTSRHFQQSHMQKVKDEVFKEEVPLPTAYIE